jgi:hypothetical protein
VADKGPEAAHRAHHRLPENRVGSSKYGGKEMFLFLLKRSEKRTMRMLGGREIGRAKGDGVRYYIGEILETEKETTETEVESNDEDDDIIWDALDPNVSKSTTKWNLSQEEIEEVGRAGESRQEEFAKGDYV